MKSAAIHLATCYIEDADISVFDKYIITLVIQEKVNNQYALCGCVYTISLNVSVLIDCKYIMKVQKMPGDLSFLFPAEMCTLPLLLSKI